ncbi:MAG: ABC transporter permease [Oscillospiraceae bacterium]|nr:ABC transporter permease [Oscillospiraceae bacterium]
MQQKATKKRSLMQDVWRRFRKSVTAMIGLVVVIIMLLTAIFAGVIAPGDGLNPGYDIQDLRNRFQPPGRAYTIETDDDGNETRIDGNFYLMGTDEFGRDIFARIVHGARISLLVGFISVTISMIIGVALGAIAGYFGRVADNLIMRSIDILLSIPPILLAISIAAALRPGLISLVIAVGIGSVPGYARIMRAAVLTVREQEFIEAARAIGAGNGRIIRRHILPNCMAPIIVQATMGMGYAILWAAALSFLGLGINPPTPEWGAMLSEARMYIRDHAHMVLFPGLSIAVIIFALNMMGDGLRDAFDPRLKK